MRFTGVAVVVFTLLNSGFALAQQNGEANSPIILTNRADSVAYAFGVSIGQDLKRTGIEQVNTDILAKAVTAALAGEAARFDTDLIRELIMHTVTEAKNKMDERLKGEAQAFMESNGAREGVQTTASGLQYEIIRKGTGETPTYADTVTVHYKGQLSNGKVFDSSYDRGEPATFELGGVIAGWQEGLQLMQAGAHYRLYLPYEMGYGERGAGEDIPPFSPLIFDVELITVKKSGDATPVVTNPVNESGR